jgi:hypothetical protein
LGEDKPAFPDEETACFCGRWRRGDPTTGIRQPVEDLVELVGIEPTTSSLRTMRSAKQPQFGVHLAADYGPKRSNSDRLAGSCLKLSLRALLIDLPIFPAFSQPQLIGVNFLSAR